MIKNLILETRDYLEQKSTKHVGDLLEHFVLLYSKSENSTEKANLQQLIIVVSYEIARRFSLYDTTIERSDDFYLDVAFTFFEKVSKDLFYTNCFAVVRNICRGKSLKNIAVFRNSKTVEQASMQNIDLQIILEESLKAELDSLPTKYRDAVLYFMLYPDNIELLENLYSDIEQFIIYSKLGKIMNKISKQSDIEVPTHTSQISHVLLLSGILKLNPKLLVLLTATKNLESIFTLCDLFGGQTFTIPSKEDLTNVINASANVASKIDADKKLTVSDREMLLHLVSDIELDEELPKIEGTLLIQDYLKQVVTNITTRYTELQDKLMTQLDFTKVSDVSKLYTILNTEFDKQVRFMSELNMAMTNVQEMSDFLTLVQSKSFEALKSKS